MFEHGSRRNEWDTVERLTSVETSVDLTPLAAEDLHRLGGDDQSSYAGCAEDGSCEVYPALPLTTTWSGGAVFFKISDR